MFAKSARVVAMGLLAVVAGSTGYFNRDLAAQVRPTDRAALVRRLDNLEAIALSTAPERERVEAIYGIAFFGRKKEAAPVASVVPRLVRIYHGITHKNLRLEIVTLMADQANPSAVAAFLVEVAKEPASHVDTMDDDIMGPLQFRAVRRLEWLGPDGRAQLRSLHDQGVVTERRARLHLDSIARRGYR